ncbi:MAG: aminotransferase class IV, partial [Desulfatirhabdiaceae bacterium]
MNIYYVDGQYLPSNEAMIPVTDLALLRGLGAFELLRTLKGKPFGLNAHLDRLKASADRIGIPLTWTLKEIAGIVMETLRRNLETESNIRIIVTGGSSTDFMTPQGNPRLIVMVTPLPSQPEWWYTQGIAVITMQTDRAMTGAKSINYVQASMALRQAREQQAVEAIYVDLTGMVREGTTSNVFMFQDGSLITPGEGILKGITRQVVLNLASSRYSVIIRDIPLNDFLGADEVFITGTNKGIVPVVKINETCVG